MKRIFLTLFLGLFHSVAGYAQGPMPPCVQEAINASRIEAGTLFGHPYFRNADNTVKSESNYEIVWEISFKENDDTHFAVFDVDMNKFGCQVNSIEPVSSNVPRQTGDDGGADRNHCPHPSCI